MLGPITGGAEGVTNPLREDYRRIRVSPFFSLSGVILNVWWSGGLMGSDGEVAAVTSNARSDGRVGGVGGWVSVVHMEAEVS